MLSALMSARLSSSSSMVLLWPFSEAVWRLVQPVCAARHSGARTALRPVIQGAARDAATAALHGSDRHGWGIPADRPKDSQLSHPTPLLPVPKPVCPAALAQAAKCFFQPAFASAGTGGTRKCGRARHTRHAQLARARADVRPPISEPHPIPANVLVGAGVAAPRPISPTRTRAASLVPDTVRPGLARRPPNIRPPARSPPTSPAPTGSGGAARLAVRISPRRPR